MFSREKDIHVGDVIVFKAIARFETRPIARAVLAVKRAYGFARCPVVKAYGHDDFIVQPNEVKKVRRAGKEVFNEIG